MPEHLDRTAALPEGTAVDMELRVQLALSGANKANQVTMPKITCDSLQGVSRSLLSLGGADALARGTIRSSRGFSGVRVPICGERHGAAWCDHVIGVAADETVWVNSIGRNRGIFASLCGGFVTFVGVMLASLLEMSLAGNVAPMLALGAFALATVLIWWALDFGWKPLRECSAETLPIVQDTLLREVEDSIRRLERRATQHSELERRMQAATPEKIIPRLEALQHIGAGGGA